ncbi:MAG: histidine ammonia-lyase [Crocinitomicaceae bacterium]|tara:strand:+ start:2380 stop:3861 length:1482 start_codon:yes stop_codon:yes gene_type:complete
MKKFVINNQTISLAQLDEILDSGVEVVVSNEAKEAIDKCRAYLDLKGKSKGKLIYGVNTGFGSLCNTAISPEDLEQLQRNLVLSHACGAGEEVPSHIVKRMLLLKAIGLSHGNSGAQSQTIERLLHFYNNNVIPIVYQQGSLGASGDLAPLAHMSLPLLGEGEVYYEGKKRSSSDALAILGLEPIILRSKEGLALLNGTQFMSAYGSYAASNAKKLWNQFNLIGALSLEAYDGRKNPFQANVNEIRNQNGQIETATVFRELFEGSEMINREKEHVQDPYSFRCIPQVHGASKDAIDYCSTIIEREINAVTDNPTVFVDEDDVVSAGNFHGQPLALSMDFLAIALAELGSISERRVYKLISGTRGLPAFLVAKPGLNSGFMIPQYTAASIVSQNKQLCSPASIDSIDSSNGQEDHVSMGSNAATKLYRVIDNCYSIQAIELMNAAQAMDFRNEKSSNKIESLRTAYRNEVAFVDNDIYLHPIIKTSVEFVKNLY